MAEPDKEKKKFWTWERTIEITKIVATLYAACLGTFVTMQFNERQHELARIEAIAKMLPNLAEKVAAPASMHSSSAPDTRGDSQNDDAKEDKDSSDGKSLSGAAPTNGSNADGGDDRKLQDSEAKLKDRMVRDGAIWAIFRTAQNKNMLRDLAALFPDDIYRVVSSIAASGGLEHDQDELTALQIASEKIANRCMDQKKTALATRLYNQAIRLKQHMQGDENPLYIIDLGDPYLEQGIEKDSDANLMHALNHLGDLHRADSDTSKKVNTGHWQSKQLYKRVREIGRGSDIAEEKLQVVSADLGLAHLYEKEHRYHAAENYLEEALDLQMTALGEKDEKTVTTQKELARVRELAKKFPAGHVTELEGGMEENPRSNNNAVTKQ